MRQTFCYVNTTSPMKKMYHLVFLFVWCFIIGFKVPQTNAQTLTRGPYLQMGNQTAVTIRWRTDVATNSRVTWGTAFGTYPNVTNDLASTTEHIVRISGLLPDTKYFYTIGSTSTVLQATNTNYVVTVPDAAVNRKLRFLAFGDCGNASANQLDTKNAALEYIGTNDIDALLTIGDNAYNFGLDNEFQLEFFDIYKDDLFKYVKMYPVPGNHDYANSSANTGVRNNAYYNSFSLPTAAECGGVASGTEAYYSYDIGNVHFVALDSYGKEDANTTKLYDTSGAQCVWLKNDLSANTKQWVVVYFHHPPYSKTSHNSDTETGDLMLIRERFIRILERYGADIVLCGHSHGYERSYLLKNYYNNPSAALLDADFNAASHTATGNTQNAKYDATANSCAYTYNSGQYNHGSVYVVSGSAGQLGGTSAGYPHNAMYYSNATNGGSFYFEVDSNRLDAKFISYSGTGAGVAPVIRDQFTIFKDVKKVTDITVTQNDNLQLTASWRGTYYWPSNGAATTKAVTVNTTTPGIYNYTVTDAASGACLKDSFHIVITAALPVVVSSYNAVLDNSRVLLNWVTQQEINNSYFSVEKSADGNKFVPLKKIAAAGNSSLPKQYRVTDFEPAEGDNYYRLSQTDFNGNTTALGIRRVTFKSSESFNAGIINTASGEITIQVTAVKPGNITVTVTDMAGRILHTERSGAQAGITIQKINLHAGLYVVCVTGSNGEKISNKILVQ